MSENGYIGRIDSFRGDFRFLSNFYPVEVSYQGLTYPSVENAYQAAKILDHSVRKLFVDITPREAKLLGRELDPSDCWPDRKLEVMEELIRKKFSIIEMAELLLLTKEYELVEGNWWNDTFWGVCNGRGMNHLGRLLMETREWLENDRVF